MLFGEVFFIKKKHSIKILPVALFFYSRFRNTRLELVLLRLFLILAALVEVPNFFLCLIIYLQLLLLLKTEASGA